jgi:hypothetical protein
VIGGFSFKIDNRTLSCDFEASMRVWQLLDPWQVHTFLFDYVMKPAGSFKKGSIRPLCKDHLRGTCGN